MSTLNPHQYGLALHTSSPQLGLSLSNFVDTSRQQTWDLDRELSNYLQLYLSEFLNPLTWQDLTFIAVAQGPGSFTSTRIGVVTARTMAQQLNLPLFGISTLAALAWSKQSEYPLNSLIPVQMKATQGLLYTAIYQKTSQQRLNIHWTDRLITPQAWQEVLTSLNLSSMVLEAPIHLGITVTSILDLAYEEWKEGKRPHWSEVVPFYGG
ncbi:peptidase M22 glycoprotease [Gloeothece citriformis PCC 7424]|uniref:Peptidase M22 glycoprotease n=1 Tax=Gloeothece citriformis (strain PCC 7424) TaxID=65393 RepID=B7KKP0_GLOC7|nr:tRNA (adenosine(37)-N6)-threonylcarbamoyltransferase complex dimerization subunit type 1 TsaB [Gloeothece citriformis]ACK71009.1 peptidase M22 glycoprotease [Gloeothece citriformis PCC 7424]